MHQKKYFHIVAAVLFLVIVGSPAGLWAAEDTIFDMDLSELMQIQITSAGRKTQNLSDVPAAIYVLDQEDIHNSGATSIPEALRMVPGLQVARVGSGKWAITARGFNGRFANKLLVQIDGRSVYAPFYSGVYWDVQNLMLEDIDRIEVIRGPGATIWGANAVNGVINIITKQSSATQGVLLSTGGGSHDRGIASLRFGTQFNENTYGRFYISHHDQDAYQFAADGSDSQDDWNVTYGGFRLDGDVGLDNSWTFQGDAYRSDYNQRVDTIWLPGTSTPLQVQDSFAPQGFNLLGRWTNGYSEKDSWSVQVYYDYFERGDIYIQQEYKIFDVDFQHRFQLAGRHDIVWGLGYRQIKDSFVSTSQISLSTESQTDSLMSMFIQDEIWLIKDRLWLTLGSKFENNEYTGNEIQPSVRLLWKPKKQHSFWASASRAVRTPSRAEDSSQILAKNIEPFPSLVIPIIVSGNPDLNSEELLAYEVGYRFSPKVNLFLDFALFYNDYDELITQQFEYGLSAINGTFINGIGGKTYGMEAIIEWSPQPWLTTEFNYSYVDLQITSSEFNDLNERIIENSSPQHQAAIRSEIKLGHNVQLNLWGRYVGKVKISSQQTDNMNLEVGDYFSLDSNISWKPRTGLELMLAGQNLLDDKHLEFVSESFTSPIEIERSVYAKLTWEF